jgi:hypothetical protein
MASQDCQILREWLGFGNPSQQSPNIILIMGIAAEKYRLFFAQK